MVRWLTGPDTMECIRNEDVDPQEAAEVCHTPLESPVEPNVKATQELADMYSHTLGGRFHYPEKHHSSVIWDIHLSENQVRFWEIARSARIGT